MKFSCFAICLMALLFTTNVTAQQADFEGTITVVPQSPDQSKIVYTLKGAMSLMEVHGTGDQSNNVTRIVTDLNAETVTTMTTAEDGRKMAVRNRLSEYDQAFTSGRIQSHHSFDPNAIRITNEKMEIDGHKCTKVVSNTPNIEGEAWVATTLNVTMQDLAPMLRRHQHIAGFMKIPGLDGLVIRMNYRNTQTGENHRIHLEVNEHSVSPSVFEIPAEYNFMDMGNLRQQLLDAKGDPAKMREIVEKMKAQQRGN